MSSTNASKRLVAHLVHVSIIDLQAGRFGAGGDALDTFDADSIGCHGALSHTQALLRHDE